MSSCSESSDSNDIVGMEASGIKNYVVVEFQDGLQLIPRNWISVDKSLAYFPDMTKINSKQFDKLVLNTQKPHSSWETFELKKIWASSDDFIRGKQKLRIALTLSETEDINSDRDELISKRKRRLLAAKKAKYKMTIDKKNRSPKKITKLSIPPLPKHFFNLSGNESPCQSPSKNSTCIDQNALDDLNFKNHEPSSPVKNVQSNTEHLPLKLCNTHRQMRLLKNDSPQSAGYKYSQGPLEGMDMSSSPLFMSSSSKVKPVSNSTPKLKSNSGVIRELFIHSPTTTPKKVIGNTKNSDFTISTLIELNIKLNKVILNQARQQQMLEDICKQLKPNNDESMFDDDVILEGFPIDSLVRLNEVNMTLKTDKLYSRKLIKKLRQFHGPSVSLVTKSIMDLLFTNYVGCKISFTGRGTLNKKDKEPLKTTLLFKIISGVILKNVKGASVSSINKAVTGWLKHAKEHYERHKEISDP